MPRLLRTDTAADTRKVVPGLYAGTIAYHPSTLGDWVGDNDPGTVGEALDEAINVARYANRAVFGGGYTGNVTGASYLAAAGGQMMSATLGYVMYAAGSIVAIGITTNINGHSDDGDLDYIAMLDGVAGMSGSVAITGNGDVSDYTSEPVGRNTFDAGEILALRGEQDGGTFDWQDTVMYAVCVFDT